MPALDLAPRYSRPQIVPFEAIVYPPDRQAQYAGRPFRRRPLAESVHVKTCAQLAAGASTRETDYYGWTREKLERFGAEYERFLLAPDKGCGAQGLDRAATLALSANERHDALAEAATERFRALFDSVRDHGWKPELGALPPTLFRLAGGRFTIHEGRHRLAVLRFLHPEPTLLRVDTEQIRTDWYRLRAKRGLKRLLLLR